MQRPATRRVIYPQVKLTLYILELDKRQIYGFIKLIMIDILGGSKIFIEFVLPKFS